MENAEPRNEAGSEATRAGKRHISSARRARASLLDANPEEAAADVAASFESAIEAVLQEAVADGALATAMQNACSGCGVAAVLAAFTAAN